jgi:GNAT superfamily N-acetyltransferase
MVEQVAQETWRLQRYVEGDETAVLELFKTVFGKPRSLEHWRWQFARNPYGGPFVSTARRASDGLVMASYSVMPIQLNVVGRAVPACQSVDTAVHPEARGQRLFEKTANDCYAWCRDAGLEAVIGFPNANSYPGFVRNLGWKRIVFPTRHVMRLSLRPALDRVVGLAPIATLLDGIYRAWTRLRLGLGSRFAERLAGRGITSHESDTVPDGYEALWNAWRIQEMLSVWKDSAYLRWRYDQNPDYRFTYHRLDRDGETLAMAVTVELDRGTVVCEFFVRGRDVAVGRLLASALCHHAVRHGRRAVTFLGHDAGFFADAFEGFEQHKAYGDVFGGRTLVEGPLGELLPHADNWTVTFGDGDFV